MDEALPQSPEAAIEDFCRVNGVTQEWLEARGIRPSQVFGNNPGFIMTSRTPWSLPSKSGTLRFQEGG